MRKGSAVTYGLALLTGASLLSCKPRDFNSGRALSVGGDGPDAAFIDELLDYHKSQMSEDDKNFLKPGSYVFSRGCALGIQDPAERPLGGALDPNPIYASTPHPDTCQNSYIDPAKYDMRGVVLRKSSSAPNSPIEKSTPQTFGESAYVNVIQIPPGTTSVDRRCFNSTPFGTAIYREYRGRSYYEVRSRGVTVGVITDIATVKEKGLDRSPGKPDLNSGFYPRVYLMPGLCGVERPWTSGPGKCKGKGGKGCPGGLDGTITPIPDPVSNRCGGDAARQSDNKCAQPTTGTIGAGQKAPSPANPPQQQRPAPSSQGGTNGGPRTITIPEPPQNPVPVNQSPNQGDQRPASSPVRPRGF